MSKEKIDIGLSLDSEKIQVTKVGLEEIKKKLEILINKTRPEVLAELSEARQQGDLSENADYDAAKNKQAEVEAEIAELQDIITKADVISESSGSTIKVGSTVSYKTEDGISKTIQIVGPVQADPTTEIPLVGSNTPLAKSLIGKKTGETIRIEAPKPYKVTVGKIV